MTGAITFCSKLLIVIPSTVVYSYCLTFFDFTFVSLLRKLSSLRDSKVKTTHRCAKCKEPNTYIINISGGPDTDINFWNIKYSALPIKVDLCFGEDEYAEYEFMPITVSQYLLLYNSGLHEDPAAMLAAQCVNAPFEIMMKKINTVNGEEETLLREVDDLLTHGIKPIPSKCAACGAVTMLRIDSSGVIFRPFRRPDQVVKDRIRFG